MNHVVRKIILALAILFSLNIILLIVLSKAIVIPSFELSNSGENILILAAHQDDGVIMSSGLIMSNYRGKTTIAYLITSPYKNIASIRMRDARRVWESTGLNNIELIFLNYISPKYSDWDNRVVQNVIGDIKTLIHNTNPNMVIIPLNEGGSNDHDILNKLAKMALKDNEEIKILQAAEYNPYYISSSTPEKVLWFMVRMLPFVPYIEPNYGLNPDNQVMIKMTDEQLDKKIKMLSMFTTEQDVVSAGQFGYPDLYDSTAQRPEYFIKLMGKYLDVWSFLLLVELSGLLFFIGIMMANIRNRLISICFFLSLAVVILAVVTGGKKNITEDGIYVLIIMLGGIFMLLYNIVHSKK